MKVRIVIEAEYKERYVPVFRRGTAELTEFFIADQLVSLLVKDSGLLGNCDNSKIYVWVDKKR